MSDTAGDPLDALRQAVQDFANTRADQPAVVDNALVIWEQVSYDGDGTVMRCIRYAVPTDNFTVSGTLGLLQAAGVYVRRDVLNDDDG